MVLMNKHINENPDEHIILITTFGVFFMMLLLVIAKSCASVP